METDRIGRIIEIKEKMKEEKERELDSTLFEIDIVNNKIDEVKTEVNVNYDRVSSNMMDGKEFYIIKDYLTFLESKKLELEEKRAELGRRVGIIKSELLELMKEVKILEKLQSKALSLLKKMDNRRQQKALDAIALRRDEASLTP